MKATTIVAVTMTAIILTAGVFATRLQAAEEKAPQNTMTVWVNGKGQTGYADKLNEQHAKMEAQGWKFAGMQLYTEDGDMQGAFVTYTR
jgi:maltose-binding protein MalE